MFIKHLDITICLFNLAIMLSSCSGNTTSQYATSQHTTSQHTISQHTTRKNTVTSLPAYDPKTAYDPRTTQEAMMIYLNALEHFDRSNNSCVLLTAAIKNFLKFIPNPKAVSLVRLNELGSMLYVFPKLRPTVFIDVQGLRRIKCFKPGGRYRLHASVLRKDGTLFLFNLAGMTEWDYGVLSILNHMKKEREEKAYKWIPGEVQHTVGVGLWWKSEKNLPITCYAEYLIDAFNYTQAIKVAV